MGSIKKSVSAIMVCLFILCIVFGSELNLYSESIPFSSEMPFSTPVVHADSYLEGRVEPDITTTNPGYCNKNFRVEVVETGAVRLTNENGRFSFFPIDGCTGNTVKVKISKDGYLTRTISLNLNSTINAPVIIKPGDMAINGVQDNAINISDIMAVAGLFNTTSQEPDFNPGYDLNGDQAINISDIMIVAKNFNSTADDYERKGDSKETHSEAISDTTQIIPTVIPTVTPIPTDESATSSSKYDKFEVVLIDKTSYPAIPNRPGLWQPGLYSNGSAPVLKWNDHIFTGFSYADNRYGMDIAEFDENGNVVKEIEKSGSRYLEKITVNKERQEVTFWGQGGTFITMSLDELFQPPTSIPTPIPTLIPGEGGAEVVIVDRANYPVPGRSDLWQPSIYMTGYAPVLKWKGHSYTGFSYTDNRYAMDIMEFDEEGNVVKETKKSGSRYLEKITVNNETQEVTFWGQGNTFITMPLEELFQAYTPTPALTLREEDPEVVSVGWMDYPDPGSQDLLQPSLDYYAESGSAPVLKYKGHTYTAFSYCYDRNSMKIIEYDEGGNIVKQIEKDGSRNLVDITYDSLLEEVFFWGQDGTCIKVSFAELFAPSAPLPKDYEVEFIGSDKFPGIPGREELWQPDLYDKGSAPVIKWKGYTYTAFSYGDNRYGMDIVKFDSEGNVVGEVEKSGARYLDDITVNAVTNSVIFHGQADCTITMSFDELYQLTSEQWTSKVKMTAASCLGTENDANKMIDYKLDSLWKSDTKNIDSQWIEIDLQDTCKMAYMMIDWGNAFAKDYQVEVLESNNGKEEWKPVPDMFSNGLSYSDGTEKMDRIDLSVETRYIRIKLNESIMPEKGFSIREIELYAIENTIEAQDSDTIMGMRGRIRLRRL